MVTAFFRLVVAVETHCKGWAPGIQQEWWVHAAIISVAVYSDKPMYTDVHQLLDTFTTVSSEILQFPPAYRRRTLRPLLVTREKCDELAADVLVNLGM